MIFYTHMYIFVTRTISKDFVSYFIHLYIECRIFHSVPHKIGRAAVRRSVINIIICTDVHVLPFGVRVCVYQFYFCTRDEIIYTPKGATAEITRARGGKSQKTM